MSKSNAVHESRDTGYSNTRERMIQAIKDELDFITYDLSNENLDPEIISAMVIILKKYDDLPLPDGFGEDEFLERFYQMKQKEPDYVPGVIAEHIHRWMLPGRLRSVSLVMLLCLILTITDQGAYAQIWGREPPTRLSMDAFMEDGVYYYKKLASDDIPRNYKSGLYLPEKLLSSKESSSIFIFRNNVGNMELNIDYRSLDGQEWLKLRTRDRKKNSDYQYLLNKNDIAVEGDCRWSNSRLYYDISSGTTTILFDIAEDSYFAVSNMGKETLLNLINQMEVIQ